MRSGDHENILNIQVKAEYIIADLETLKAFCDPLRHAIMRCITEQPLSIRQIAEQLGKPFTNLYYHINILEKSGLIYLAGQRLISGAVLEKYYHVSAKVFRVERRLLTFIQDPEHERLELLMDDALDETRTNIRLALASQLIQPNQEPPHPASALIMQRIQQMPAEEARRFYQEVIALLDTFDKSHHNVSNEPANTYSLTVALHPSNDS
jgi:DNA-binding transcriptional ArsR family regulator